MPGPLPPGVATSPGVSTPPGVPTPGYGRWPLAGLSLF